MAETALTSSRRHFIFKTATTFLAANASIYILGSAFKNLNGSMVAGAKTWHLGGAEDCPTSGPICSPANPDGNPCSGVVPTCLAPKPACSGVLPLRPSYDCY